MEEELLLLKSEEGSKWKALITWKAFLEELKKVASLASLMVAVFVSKYLLQGVSLMTAGHLGELSLAGVAIATSISNVTGFSLLFGLAGTLETLCGQAYGAGQCQKLGTYTYCSMISLILICIPICVLWIFMEELLILIGQDPEVVAVACKYAIWLIPALFAYAILQSQFRYFQSQSMILPMLLSCCTTLCFHAFLCWALVYKWDFGYVGAALAIAFSYWLNVIFLALYMIFSPSCERTRRMCWEDFLSSSKELVCFALPSAVMVCLEWWTFEIITLLSGILPDSKLQTSVLSICLSVDSIFHNVQYANAVAASTRVSNELGAGKPQAARAVVCVVVLVSVAEATIVGTILFCFRHILGYAFSSDIAVADYVSQTVSSRPVPFFVTGIARGCGLQRVGAIINFGAYYVVGLPVAVILGFVVGLGAKGLYIGILTGSAVQSALLALLTISTNWEKQTTKARERIFEPAISVDGESI